MNYIDCHLHFHDPKMTDDKILNMVRKEFPFMDKIFNEEADNSPVLEWLEKEGAEAGWVINYESPDVMGFSEQTNEWVAKFCEDSEGKLIPFGGIVPSLHEDAAEIMRDYFESGLLFGLKVNGPHQLVKPNAYTTGLESQEKLYQM